MKSTLKLSIVIPVYNEERYIKRCLEAIASQTVQPLEVIVVDNNCTDRTVEIAQKYQFVKVIKEPPQGRGPARTRGFNEARGDIIGRIDADAIIRNNWVERAITDFTGHDIGALSGLAEASTLPYGGGLHTTLWPRAYYWWTDAFFGVRMLWGANMAIRRDVWQKIKNKVVLDDTKVHEDQDLALLVAGAGYKVKRDNYWMVRINGQSYYQWPKFHEYVKRRRQTKQYHQRSGTLDSIKAHGQKLSFWQTWPYFIPLLIPGLLFVGSSQLVWRLQMVWLWLFGKKAVVRR